MQSLKSIEMCIDNFEQKEGELMHETPVRWAVVNLYRNLTDVMREIKKQVELDLEEASNEGKTCMCAKQEYCKFYEEAKQGEDDSE